MPVDVRDSDASCGVVKDSNAIFKGWVLCLSVKFGLNVKSQLLRSSQINNPVMEVHVAKECEVVVEKMPTKDSATTDVISQFEEDVSPPDGGLQAWSQVFACWLLFMNTWYVVSPKEFSSRLRSAAMMILTLSRGLTNSFSIFETYYTTTYPTLGHSAISWIGSLQLFFTLFVGIFAGRFIDGGHLRAVVITGMGFEVLGMMMTSFCTRYWQVVLAQGVCVGMGSGCLAFTSAAVIPFYFKRRRMLAAGIVSTGSSVGGYSPLHTGMIR
jgi:hypothetical protein